MQTFPPLSSGMDKEVNIPLSCVTALSTLELHPLLTYPTSSVRT